MSVKGPGGPSDVGPAQDDESVKQAATEAPAQTSASSAPAQASGEDTAQAIEDSIDAMHEAGPSAAADTARRKVVTEANKIAAPLLLPSFGFPRINENAKPEAVQGIQDMLGKLEDDGSLEDFAGAVKDQQAALIASHFGRRPMDWFGPADTWGALVQKFGTDSQKETFAAAKGTPLPGSAGVTDAIDAYDAIAANDPHAAAAAALAAAGLDFPDGTYPDPIMPIDPGNVDRFKNFLGQVEANGQIHDLEKAIGEENASELADFKAARAGQPRSPEDLDLEKRGLDPDALAFKGPSVVITNLVVQYGTQSQRDKWGVGRFGSFPG